MKEEIKKLLNVKGALAENEVKDLLKAFNIITTKYEVVRNLNDLKKLKLKFWN